MIVIRTTRRAQAHRPLSVLAAGICCAVGHTAAAASCALRAGMDHFQESHFRVDGGKAIAVGRLPESDRWGADRLALWLNQAVQDCIGQVDEFSPDQTPVYMLTADSTRPYSDELAQFATIEAVRALLPFAVHPSSQVFAAGRAGLAQALRHAHSLFESSSIERVLVVGVDSFLNAPTINHYLAQDRLAAQGGMGGFIPGEAAAAILLQAGDADKPGLRITGWGIDVAEGRIDGSVPSRARALARAMRRAMSVAGITTNDLAFRLSDQNGEPFYAREAVNALTRVSEPGGPQLPTLTTADCTGEVGAATGPLMLAWLHNYLAHRDSPGKTGMLHMANDDGERCAVTVRWQGERAQALQSQQTQ